MRRNLASMLVVLSALSAFSVGHTRDACAAGSRPLGVGDVVTVTIGGDRAGLAKDDAANTAAHCYGMIGMKVAAIITSVRPDGRLALAAEREIRIDETTWHNSLSGIVRPDDFDPVTRTIDSSQIADFRWDTRVVEGDSSVVEIDSRDLVGRADHADRPIAEQRLKQYEVRVRFAEERAAVDGKKMPAKMLAAPTIVVLEKQGANIMIGGEAQVGKEKMPLGTSLSVYPTTVDNNRVRLAGVLEVTMAVSAIGSPEEGVTVRESTAVHFDKMVTCGETIRLCMSESEKCSRYFELIAEEAEETRVDSPTEPVGAAATSAEVRLLPSQR